MNINRYIWHVQINRYRTPEGNKFYWEAWPEGDAPIWGFETPKRFAHEQDAAEHWTEFAEANGIDEYSYVEEAA